MTFGYGYDAAGRISVLATAWNNNLAAFPAASRPSTLTNFTYDDAGQLTSVNEIGGPNDATYGYGLNGNRTTSTELSGSDSYVPGPQNRVSQDSTYTYTYDAEGNVIQRTVTLDPGDRTYYTWDHRNRLVKVEHINGDHSEPIVEYRYNASDELVRRRLDEPFSGEVNVVEHYVVEAGRRTMALDSDGDVLHRYQYGPAGDVLFDQVFDGAGAPTTQPEVDLRLPLADHQNSTRVVLGHDAADAAFIRQSVDYAPFGSITSIKDAAGQTTTAALDTAFAHHGSVVDNATKLQLKGARWYSPDLGRFVSTDPIQDSANWYAFAGNDPVNFADPSGLSPSFHPLGNSTLSNSYVNAKSILNPGGLNLNLGGSYFASPPTASRSNVQYLPIEPRFQQAALNVLTGATPGFRNELAAANAQLQSLQLNAHLNAVGRSLAENTFRSAVPANSQFSQTNRPAWEQGLDRYLAGVGQVFAGYGDAATGAAEAAYNTVFHPIQTAQGVYSAARHPILTVQAIAGQIGEQSQSLRGQGQIVGDLLGSIAGGGALKAIKQTQVAQRAISAGAAAARNAGRALDRLSEVIEFDASTLSSGGLGAIRMRTSSPKVQTHHLMTNKNSVSATAGGPFTPLFEDLAQQRGITLNQAVNKIDLPGHIGPHPAYNAEVYRRLNDATQGLKDKVFNQAFDRELNKIRTQTLKPGTTLNKLATGQGGS